MGMGDAVTPGVSRGILATQGRVIFGRTDAAHVTETAFARLRQEPPGGYAWKEKVHWARRLARGDSDFYGRRVLSDAGRSDCRYVAKVCRRAWKKDVLPEGRTWGNLRESLRRIFTELAGEEA
jgi:hypothetical protein